MAASIEDPKHLFKYRSLEGDSRRWVRETIVQKKIWLSQAAEFNDPFDLYPIYNVQATKNEYRRYVDRMLSRRRFRSAYEREKMRKIMLSHYENRKILGEVITDSMRQNLNAIGMFCLSETPSSVLMWGHYASSHKGVCLRFKATDDTSYIGGAQKILYQRERPVINLVSESENDGVDKSLLTKADYWSYEKEWRYFDLHDGPGVLTLPPKVLDGVVLGANISDENRELVNQWVTDQHDEIEVLEAKFSRTQFAVDIRSGCKPRRPRRS